MVSNAIAHIAVDRASAAWFNKSTMKQVDSAREHVLERLKAAQSNTAEPSLRELHKTLRSLVDSKSSGRKRSSSSSSSSTKTASVNNEVSAVDQVKSCMSSQWLNDTALQLLYQWDKGQIAWHARTFASEDERHEHEHNDCIFRVVQCEHGCNAKFSAHYREKHTASCPEKLIQCQLGCGVQVARARMTEHMHTSCDLRPAKCPFADLGCTPENLTHKDIDEHLSNNVQRHIFLLHEKLLVIKDQVGDQDREIGELHTTLTNSNASARDAAATASAASQQIHDLHKRLKDIEEHSSSDQKKLKDRLNKVEKHNAQLETEIKQLKEAYKRESAWRNQLSKQLESSSTSH